MCLSSCRDLCRQPEPCFALLRTAANLHNGLRMQIGIQSELPRGAGADACRQAQQKTIRDAATCLLSSPGWAKACSTVAGVLHFFIPACSTMVEVLHFFIPIIRGALYQHRLYPEGEIAPYYWLLNHGWQDAHVHTVRMPSILSSLLLLDRKKIISNSRLICYYIECL